MSRQAGTARPPPAQGPPGGPAPRWDLWHGARGLAPTALVAGLFIAIACWNVIGAERPPGSAVATGLRTNDVGLQDHPERAAHAQTLRALEEMRAADRAFVLAVEEALTETRHPASRAAAPQAKRQAEAAAAPSAPSAPSAQATSAAERQAALRDARRPTATPSAHPPSTHPPSADPISEAARQAVAREADRQAEEAIRQEAAREAQQHADEGVQQAASREAMRHADEAPAKVVPPSPDAPSPPGEQALPPAASDPDGAPGLLVKVRSGETLQSLYLRVYRGLTPPPFESVAAINPERIRPGDIVIFPPPVDGWMERNDADAVSSLR